MKKVFSIIAVLAVASTFVACGPSQAELDAEKAKQDSIRIADSIAAIPPVDTTTVAPVDTAASAPATETTEKK
jgi:PBP1b-binding outer membrane lipoprotein LpoB